MTKQALVGTTRSLRTLSDGTVRIQVDIEPNDALAAMQFWFAKHADRNGLPER